LSAPTPSLVESGFYTQGYFSRARAAALAQAHAHLPHPLAQAQGPLLAAPVAATNVVTQPVQAPLRLAPAAVGLTHIGFDDYGLTSGAAAAVATGSAAAVARLFATAGSLTVVSYTTPHRAPGLDLTSSSVSADWAAAALGALSSTQASLVSALLSPRVDLAALAAHSLFSCNGLASAPRTWGRPDRTLGHHTAWLSSLAGVGGTSLPLGFFSFVPASAPSALFASRHVSMPLLPRVGFLPLPLTSISGAPALFVVGVPTLTSAGPSVRSNLAGLPWAGGAFGGPSYVSDLPLSAQVVTTQAQFASYRSSYPCAHSAPVRLVTLGRTAPFSSSEWLVGVSSSRPGRPFAATADLVNFANGGVGLAYSPWDSVPCLFN
jgi:hypothetical protein